MMSAIYSATVHLPVSVMLDSCKESQSRTSPLRLARQRSRLLHHPQRRKSPQRPVEAKWLRPLGVERTSMIVMAQ